MCGFCVGAWWGALSWNPEVGPKWEPHGDKCGDQSWTKEWTKSGTKEWTKSGTKEWTQVGPKSGPKVFFVFLWGRRNLVKSCCDSFAKEQFCMKTMKIKKCVTIWVAGLSLGVVWADGLGRGLGPLFGPRGGLAEETDGWAGGTGPDRPGCPCWARAGGREGSRTYCLAACSDAFQ